MSAPPRLGGTGGVPCGSLSRPGSSCSSSRSPTCGCGGRVTAGTGGQYFRAADPTGLSRAVAAIDRLEAAEARFRAGRQHDDRFALALLPAALLLAAELALGATWLRTLP